MTGPLTAFYILKSCTTNHSFTVWPKKTSRARSHIFSWKQMLWRQTRYQHVAERFRYLLRCCLVSLRYACCPKNKDIHSFLGLFPSLSIHSILCKVWNFNEEQRSIILQTKNFLSFHKMLIGKTRADFVTQYHQSLWFTPQFKAISECRQKKFPQAEIENKRSRKVALKPVRQTLVWCRRREVFKRRYALITKEEG